MSIEEAIKILAFDEEYFHTEKECEAYIMAMEALKEKNERKQEWIPCSERLPERDGKYLVTMNGFESQKLMVTTSIFVNSTKEWYPNCIAWMPLPEPYGKEESE